MAITRENIREVRGEMERLEQRFKDLEKCWIVETSMAGGASAGQVLSWDNPRETGAVRRASMDLTRALARLRAVDR